MLLFHNKNNICFRNLIWGDAALVHLKCLTHSPVKYNLVHYKGA